MRGFMASRRIDAFVQFTLHSGVAVLMESARKTNKCFSRKQRIIVWESGWCVALTSARLYGIPHSWRVLLMFQSFQNYLLYHKIAFNIIYHLYSSIPQPLLVIDRKFNKKNFVLLKYNYSFNGIYNWLGSFIIYNVLIV